MAELQDYIILFLIWFTSVVVVRALLAKYRTGVRRPPGPLALPIIGHFHLLGSKPYRSLHNLSLRYGPLFQLYLGSTPCVVVSSPEMAKEFLQTHDISFSDRPKLSNADYLTYGSSDLAFSSYGPYWKFMKKLCMTKLLGLQTLEKFVPVMREERHLFLQRLLGKAEAGEAVDVKGEVMRLTNNLVTRIIMRHRCSESEDDAGEVREFMREIVQLTGSFNLSDFIWFCKRLDLQRFKKRVREARGRFDAMMERIMRAHEEERRQKKDKNDGGDTENDLLDILLDIMEDEKQEMKLKRENVKAIVLNIFGGGTETSAGAVVWAMAELINNPNIMEKARKEIDSIVGKDRLVEESDIEDLPYLQAIVKETLRLHPPGALTARESTEDCTVAGYHIPRKTQLFVNIWAIGRDPNYWENPLEFWPDRFLREDGGLKSQLDVRGQHFHLLPFGSGRRICPGISLALNVVQTSLAAMIQCFEWRVGDGNYVDMEEGPDAALAHPLIIKPYMADLQSYITYILIWLLSAIMVRAFITQRGRTKHRRPPGPLALPLIGHLHLILLSSKPHLLYQRLSRRYGPLMHLFLGSVPCVVVTSAEMAKEVLLNDIVFCNRPKRVIYELVTYGYADLVFAPYGSKWRLMKKLCMTELLGMQTINNFAPIMREERNRFLQALQEKSKSSEAIAVKTDILRLTSDIVSRMSMGKRCSESENEAAQMKKSIYEMSRAGGKFNVADSFWFCKKLDLQGLKKKGKAGRERFDSVMERIISQHEDARKKKVGDGNGEVKDFIDMLLDIMEDKNAEMRLTRENIKALMMNIFGGGTATTADAIEWALAELINHPNVMERARQEIDSLVGKDRLVEASDITNLPYIEAIARETLRLHPAGPTISRESTEDCTVGGYQIPAKTHVLIHVWAIGRDPNSWENPLEFRPERFLNKEGGINRRLNVRGQQFQLLPFGSGRRFCPGATLALQVFQTTIAAIIQCFDWKVEGGGNGKVNMEEGHGSSRAHPLVCVPVARLNPLPI